MALVNIINVSVLDNPNSFTTPFQFEITFECLQELSDDLEWKVIYVGNAEDSSGDQALEEVMVGPIPIGINRFVLEANAPNPSMINNQDLIGVTVILITCSYMDNKFVQIGYYVNNEYSDFFETENFPNPVDINKLSRNILADQPRVTRFAIDWMGISSNNNNNNNNDNNVNVVSVFGNGDDDEEVVVVEEDDLDLAIEENEVDEESDDDDEDIEDENGEVDLEMEEESYDEDDEEEGEDDDGMVSDDIEQYNPDVAAGAVIMNEDSMDVERMLQQ